MTLFHTYHLPPRARAELAQRGVDVSRDISEQTPQTLDWLRGAAMAGYYHHAGSWDLDGSIEAGLARAARCPILPEKTRFEQGLEIGDIVVAGTDMYVLAGDDEFIALPRYPRDQESCSLEDLASIIAFDGGCSQAEAAVLHGLCFGSTSVAFAEPVHVWLLDAGLLEPAAGQDGHVALSALGRAFVERCGGRVPVRDQVLLEPPQEPLVAAEPTPQPSWP